jgi:hypothetical protein
VTKIAHDFTFLSKILGRIIIEEFHVSIEEKTIRPLSGKGIAGGLKFKTHDMFIKFAVDENKVFGSNYAAMKVYFYYSIKFILLKAAAHDLRGMRQVLLAQVPFLYIYLMTLIDFAGFRLIFTSNLPISPLTLEVFFLIYFIENF